MEIAKTRYGTLFRFPCALIIFSRLNILEFNEAIRKFTANDNQNNLAQSKPPNGGWGWVIVFSCFIYNMIIGKLHMKMLIRITYQLRSLRIFFKELAFNILMFQLGLDTALEYF